MKFDYLKQKTSNLLVLNKNLLRTLEPQESVLEGNIKYWLATGKLLSIKKGKYILAEKLKMMNNKDNFLEYLAEETVKPSYLSTEYVLAKYQILSEPVRIITLVTTKKTQVVNNDLGTFQYYSISEKLFTGYIIKDFEQFSIAEASKSKAMFDFLYFRFLKSRQPTEEAVENLRINWENISQKEFAEIVSYEKIINSKRIRRVLKIIENKYYVNK